MEVRKLKQSYLRLGYLHQHKTTALFVSEKKLQHMKKISLLLLAVTVFLNPFSADIYKSSFLSASSALSPALAAVNVVPVEHGELSQMVKDERSMFIVDRQGETDTMLRMRTAGREYIHRDLEATIQSGHAVNFDLVRAHKAIAAVGINAYMESLFSGSVDEIAKRLMRRLSVSSGNSQAAADNLKAILSDSAELNRLRANMKKILFSIADSPESLRSRNVIILIDGENDFFSLGFVLMHAGHYRGRDSIYVHSNFLDSAPPAIVQSVFEYGDRCLKASRALEDIPEFRAIIKSWWVEWVRSNLKNSIARMRQHDSDNGISVSGEMNKRINNATHLTDLFGLWNEFRAAEILSRKGWSVLNMGQSLIDEHGGTLGEYDALIQRADGKYGIVETKSWNYTSPNPASIKDALVGKLEHDSLSQVSRRTNGKLGRFLTFYQRRLGGEKFSGIPDDFEFGELIIMVDNEAVESVLYQLALNDTDVRARLMQYREAGIEVKCGFMPKNSALWPAAQISNLTELLNKPGAIDEADGEVVMYSDRGIPLFGRAIDYYNACVRVADRNRGQIDMSQYLKNSDGYEELLVKLKNLDSILGKEGRKIADSNVHIPDSLTWVDALVNVAPDLVSYVEKAIKINNKQGTKRFVALGNSLEKLYGYLKECVVNGDEIDKKFVLKNIRSIGSQVKKARKLLKGKSSTRKERNKKDLAQLDMIMEQVEKLRRHLKPNIEAVHTTRVFVHQHSKASEVAEGKRRVEKQLRNIVDVFSSPEARDQLGDISRVRLYFDTRGHNEIREFISSRKDDIETRTGGLVKISFTQDLEQYADHDVNFASVRNRLVPLLRKYSPTYLIRLFNVVYSRFVGLLFEMQGVEFLKYSMGYDILAHGIEIYDPDTDVYVSELDAVLRDQSISGTREEPVYKICEIRSCRTPLQFEKFLQERFYYKPETYDSKRAVIDATIKELAEDENAKFSEVVFMLDVGRNFEFIDQLIELEPKFSETYGFPIKFIFLESSPYGITVASQHNLGTINLVPIDNHFIEESSDDFVLSAA